jgi:hypothetical protein
MALSAADALLLLWEVREIGQGSRWAIQHAAGMLDSILILTVALPSAAVYLLGCALARRLR